MRFGTSGLGMASCFTSVSGSCLALSVVNLTELGMVSCFTSVSGSCPALSVVSLTVLGMASYFNSLSGSCLSLSVISLTKTLSSNLNSGTGIGRFGSCISSPHSRYV